MLKHIVMVKFNDRGKGKDLSIEFKSKLLELIKKIPELKNMEVGVNISTKPSAYDLVLIASFDDEEGLNKYRIHPAHVKVLDFMKNVLEKTAVVDYNTD